MSRTSMDKGFLKALGRTPAAEIRRVQVEMAGKLLLETEESLERIAFSCGFSDAKQFGRTFRHQTGKTPTAYRKQSPIELLRRRAV